MNEGTHITYSLCYSVRNYNLIGKSSKNTVTAYKSYPLITMKITIKTLKRESVAP